MSKRIRKVDSLLAEEISKIIAKDFEFSGAIVTITHVATAVNLAEAKAYISVFPKEASEKVMSVLKKGAYYIQQKINKALKMRPIPKIVFVEDKETTAAGRVEELLEQLKKEGK